MFERSHLDRFVHAQEPVIEQVRAELRAGRKSSHWMWFVFPQLARLGFSQRSQFYGIASLEEARAYLDHAVLGPRLVECTGLVNAVTGRTVHDIFGSPDDMKFRSSMTLFAVADPDAPSFGTALEKYFEGGKDPRTLELLGVPD
ncbi:MAG: DUF1810 domain-containing protein [Pseudomonadota bacterium]|nr:DUF1810 domain-containing protein [Pseudomonadota bacterium]MDQ2705775.1 DUF1810 domain-containing protein [Pseudomonadota bacterium]